MDSVGVGAKRSTQTVYSANMDCRDHYLQCKKVNPHTVDSGNAVGVGAKRSIHTVYSANVGGGDCYL